MTKLSMTSMTLASALALGALGMSISGASAADTMMNQKEYENALTDCQMLDNPDRRQQCKDKVMQKHDQYEKSQKSDMKDMDKSKTKQY